MKKTTGLIGRFKKAWGTLLSPSSTGGWWPVVKEAFGGAWQNNIEIRNDQITAYHAVFACVTLIASDISKLGIDLIQKSGGAWVPTTNNAYSPVLRKPNKNQSRIQFIENWMLSKLLTGNTYVLKIRDGRGVVTGLKILDPINTKPLISPDGSVFYSTSEDNFNGLTSGDVGEAFPASEIIHDRFNCMFHPLIGVSPLYACGLAAMQGYYIQTSQTKLFENGVQAPGILTAPGAIGDATAARLKAHWEENYTGEKNYGKVAVLGDGLKFEKMSMTAADSQLIEQLRWTAEVICSVFHVPPYMIGVGEAPPYTNIQSVNMQYYTQALQNPIESIELCLDEGLNLPSDIGVQMDIDGLLRMDEQTRSTTLTNYSKAGVLKLNEVRNKIGYQNMVGGNSAFLQQQNFSVTALAKRDAGADPFATAPAQPVPSTDTNDNGDNQDAAKLFEHMSKSIKEGIRFEI
jgi:HK97 family phage portal protein